MSVVGQSIEDLLPDSANEDSAPAKLQQKIKSIDLKEKEGETKKKADELGLSYINLDNFGISPDTITTIKEAQARELKVICFLNTGKEIRLGAVDYNDNVKELEQQLSKKKFASVETYLISNHSFEKGIKVYEALPKIRKFSRGIEIKSEDIEKLGNEVAKFTDLNEKLKNISLTEMVSLIIAAAIKSRSSDIHVEAEEGSIKVRFRIDGVLNDVADIEKQLWPQIISRIKQLAKLKININDKPQDGRFTIFLSDDKIDVRVSCLPTAFGESVVMRLLMSSFAGLDFEDLGLRGQALDFLTKEINRPNGMIVTTGPTGSGKTTTLYSILRKINNPEIKIITIEDPIEYELEGVNQSQVNDKYTFAKGLKAIVRQDPDIIMVGEIRDLDTAEIAIQAALTGHLVLSTIHTNDAFGAIPRFLSMGAKPYLLAPALNLSVGQRLVRRLCKCKEKTEINSETLEKVKALIEKIPSNSGYSVETSNLNFYKPKGCEECQGIGYKGRVGIFEIIPITDKMKNEVTKGNLSEFEIKEMAFAMGVITMVQDGILKVLDGLTSIEEVFRVAE